MMDAATLRQNQAAEPAASTWLTANAGSGKTRVLTDRVARLLLDEVQPQNILCLTYTKAAASEMQNRLFRRLGDWAMKPDAALAEELAALGVPDVMNADRLTKARRLFARAIETPGGLRIQTIHSFCASLLRRFPLEAGVTPGFVEMDDRTAALLHDDVVEEIAEAEGANVIDEIATLFSGNDLGPLTRAIIAHREALMRPASRNEILGWFGLPEGFDVDRLLAEVFLGGEAALLQELLTVLKISDKVTDQRAAERIAPLNLDAPGIRELEELSALMLTGASAKEPFTAKVGTFPTRASQDALGDRYAELIDLMLRVECARDRRNGLFAARKTDVLYRFAAKFLPAYERRKQLHGWLDFDDLIHKTRTLLSNEAVSAWVLFRLDGGLDHILIDEAQDTSPAQWQVIERLAQEFTSGQGARDNVERTIFVVGDVKQSIYSFQGADPREFERMRRHFSERLLTLDLPLRQMELEYSFRSSDAILRFVDQVISVEGSRHRAFQDSLPGRVDLWPAVPKTDCPAKRHWYDPVDILTEDHQELILARHIADEIKTLIESETIPARNGTRRKIRAGDILILVRRRSTLFEEIIRACKIRGLPVAGADRLKLGAELAVRDIRALLAFLATSEDDLSLAAALRSPLLGWSEAQLFDLAHGRAETYLWPALRNRAAEFPDTIAMLQDLRDGADFLRPYDLIERVLTRHDGRRLLLGRLGPEAEDGIDALLAQTLTYERMEIPSLTGFLTWLETDEVEIKRQMDSAGDLIRVMTVHGAKGLESPIVILPDTAKRALPAGDELLQLDAGQVVWRVPAAERPVAMETALSRLKSSRDAETERLLYVAMTRAETWLIIAASGDVGSGGESWHQIAEAGLRSLGAVSLPTPAGEGLRLSHLDWTAGETETPSIDATAKIELPEWAKERIAPPVRRVSARSPSDLGGAKAIWGTGEFDEERSLRHGRMVHRLLEVLPDVPAAQWQDYAGRLLATGEDIATPQEVSVALQEARAVLQAPELAYLFDAAVLSEVDISAALPDLGGARIAGTIDKLLISEDAVLAVDFKTNVIVPDAPHGTPEGILRQMGAYQAALETVYPGRRVDTAILWTGAQILMPLPNDIVRRALSATPDLDAEQGGT